MSVANTTYSPPTKLNTLLEIRAPFEMLSLLPLLPKLVLAPSGDNRPIVLAPGYSTDERSMWPLGHYLKFLGYRVFDWGLGKNNGNVEADIHRFNQVINDLYDELGEPITLIGWSLGGVVSREVARLQESKVREVITMGTPIAGGPKYTAIANRFANAKSLDLDVLELEIHERNSLGIKQPVTSIYSKSDGIVGWQASLDTYNRQARNIEVKSSHLGLGVNPKIWLLLSKLLASE